LLEAVASDGAAPDHGVDAADADRLGGDQHLPVGGTWVGPVDDGQAVGTSERPDLNCLQGRLLVLGPIRTLIDAAAGLAEVRAVTARLPHLRSPALDHRGPIPRGQAGSNRTGRFGGDRKISPWTCTSSASGSSRNPGSRSSTAFSSTRISIRARCIPRHL
jgi:hypothetical protein